MDKLKEREGMIAYRMVRQEKNEGRFCNKTDARTERAPGKCYRAALVIRRKRKCKAGTSSCIGGIVLWRIVHCDEDRVRREAEVVCM